MDLASKLQQLGSLTLAKLLPQFRANERGNDGAESGMPSQALGICELHQSCV